MRVLMNASGCAEKCDHHNQEKGELFKKYSQQKRDMVGTEGFRNMSEENANEMIDIYMAQKEAELQLEKKYIVRFKEVLKPRQTWAMVRFEGEFRRTVLDKMMKRRAGQKQQRGQKGNGN